MYRGVEQWLARMAHNHQVAGSNPAPATKIKYLSADRYFILVTGQGSNLRPRQFTGAGSVGRVAPCSKISLLILQTSGGGQRPIIHLLNI